MLFFLARNAFLRSSSLRSRSVMAAALLGTELMLFVSAGTEEGPLTASRAVFCCCSASMYSAFCRARLSYSDSIFLPPLTHSSVVSFVGLLLLEQRHSEPNKGELLSTSRKARSKRYARNRVLETWHERDRIHFIVCGCVRPNLALFESSSLCGICSSSSASICR
jgi:hypothetical protein